MLRPPTHPLLPYPTLYRSANLVVRHAVLEDERKIALHSRIAWQRLIAYLPKPVLIEPVQINFRHVYVQIGEHTSELQSHVNLVCRLLLEKKKKKKNT